MKIYHHKLLINIKWPLIIIQIGNLKYKYGHLGFLFFVFILIIVQSSIPEILVTVLDKRLTSES